MVSYMYIPIYDDILAFLVSWKNLLFYKIVSLELLEVVGQVNIFPKLNGGLEVIYRDGICKQINLNKHKLLSSGQKLCQLQNRIDFRAQIFGFRVGLWEV